MILNYSALRLVSVLPVPKRLPQNSFSTEPEFALESRGELVEMIEDVLEHLSVPQAQAIRLTHGFCQRFGTCLGENCNHRPKTIEEMCRYMHKTEAEVLLILADALTAFGKHPRAAMLESIWIH